jgi:hypothetical protein
MASPTFISDVLRGEALDVRAIEEAF